LFDRDLETPALGRGCHPERRIETTHHIDNFSSLLSRDRAGGGGDGRDGGGDGRDGGGGYGSSGGR
jgi:hypothetical protein